MNPTASSAPANHPHTGKDRGLFDLDHVSPTSVKDELQLCLSASARQGLSLEDSAQSLAADSTVADNDDGNGNDNGNSDSDSDSSALFRNHDDKGINESRGDDDDDNYISCTPRKHVRFAVNENDDGTDSVPVSQTIENPLVLTAKDRRNAWWSKEESDGNFEFTRRLVTECRKERREYMRGFALLFSTCATCARKLNQFDAVDLPMQRRMRGLERYVHDILPRYKNGMIHSVLDIQSKLPMALDAKARARILAIKASQLSRPSRTLARYMAKQDALEVFEFVQEEINQSSFHSIGSNSSASGGDSISAYDTTTAAASTSVCSTKDEEEDSYSFENNNN